MSFSADAIESRYTKLANESCCLSCGGAIDHAHPRPGEICVDLGSGRGKDVIRMAEAVGGKGHAYGIDISEGMLQKARKTSQKLGLTNVTFKQSAIESIPLAENSIDILISNCTINHAHDKHAVWQEVYRVLKPGGRFAVSDIYSLRAVPERYRTDPQAVAECWAGSVTRDEYLETLIQAGFEYLTIAEESAPYRKGAIEVASITLLGSKPSPNK